jgi:chorismate mutase-like protein
MVVSVLGFLIVGSIAPIHALTEYSSQSDRFADALVGAVSERLALAIPVAASKRASGSPVDDPVREAQAADAFLALVTPRGIPERAAREFIQAQFEGSKFIQRTLLQQWDSRPATAPVSNPPNLATQVRPAIDLATENLARTFVVAWNFARQHPRAWGQSLARELSPPPGTWRWERVAVRMSLEPLMWSSN